MTNAFASVCAVAVAMAATSAANAQGCELSLDLTFNPAEGGQTNGIAFDPTRDEVIVHFNGSTMFHVYDRDGAFLRTFPKASAVGGNDGDMIVLDSPVTIAGINVPAGSLIEFENENDPPRVVASDTTTGAVIAIQNNFPGGETGQWVGGAYASGTGAFFAVDWQGDVIERLDVQNGLFLDEFPVDPVGSPAPFDVFYGDIDVLDEDGYIYVVSSSQSRIRVMTQTGDVLTDIEVGDLMLDGVGVLGMSGIAFDQGRNEAWFSSTGSSISRVSGFNGVTTCPDTNGDNFIDLADILNILAAFGEPTSDGPSGGDVDGCQSGTVDLSDILAVLARFGETCE